MTSNQQPETSLPDKPVLTLFQLWSDNPQINTAARIITSRLIKDYSYEKVYEAFLEAATKGKDKLTLAYVRGILIKKAQQESVKKNIAESKIRAQNTKALESSESFMSSGSLLNILEEEIKKQKSKVKSDQGYKETDKYKKLQKDFENEIKKEGIS